ncbi:DNA (cytosine-5-)-methyltransferase [Georgenia sp. SYP-B2076]|uniref:DNA (cytosine-5-)-methyltransferase n=1 Tax=Georgenia sp. SYP-B2076 TaxID=2495881 RepID=UPI000F8DCBEF|nr:DNA (cytosine-5-)-methyltransferase [Georgenia sp. SYP-B2076]
MTTASAPFTFVDLFAGIGGFHSVLSHAGGRCVYVSEIDDAARSTYVHNWVTPLPEKMRPTINTDINLATPDEGLDPDFPENFGVLAAGFPCQPFSKSGHQHGMEEARGTLFWNIARILEERHPPVILLENVRNLVGPRHRHEWDVIIDTLRELGYRVSSKPTVFSPHFLPPSMGGTPQVRERVFILGTYIGPERVKEEIKTRGDVPPTLTRGPVNGWDPRNWDVEWVLDDDADIENIDRYRLTTAETKPETEWINVWDDLVQRMWAYRGERLPGFPLWADAWVPESSLNPNELDLLPPWKADFLIKNARFYDQHRDIITAWRTANPNFNQFPPSRRKLEWQAQDATSLWETVMHFRPSGIRAKAPTYVPALVAITQTSIVGKRRRKITPHEAARLQGLPRWFDFANAREALSYKQVGNGVAAGAAWYVFRAHVERDQDDLPRALVRAVLDAPLNPTGDALSPEAFAFEAELDRESQELLVG